MALTAGAGQVEVTFVRNDSVPLCPVRVSMETLIAENAAAQAVFCSDVRFLEGHEGIKYFVKSLAGKLI